MIYRGDLPALFAFLPLFFVSCEAVRHCCVQTESALWPEAKQIPERLKAEPCSVGSSEENPCQSHRSCGCPVTSRGCCCVKLKFSVLPADPSSGVQCQEQGVWDPRGNKYSSQREAGMPQLSGSRRNWWKAAFSQPTAALMIGFCSVEGLSDRWATIWIENLLTGTKYYAVTLSVLEVNVCWTWVCWADKILFQRNFPKNGFSV